MRQAFIIIKFLAYMPVSLQVPILWYYLKRKLGLSYDPNIRYMNGFFDLSRQIQLRITKYDPQYLKISIGKSQLSFYCRSIVSSDIEVIKDLYVDEEYRGFITFIKQFVDLERPMIAIDAGANIGLFSVYLKSKTAVSKIIAIEPDPANAEVARQNLDLHFGQEYVLYQNALWVSQESLIIHRDFRGGTDWSLAVKRDLNNTGMKGVPLSVIFKESAIEYVDILKMDIEGSEKELLEDFSFLSDIKRVKFLCIEIHEEVISMNLAQSILEKQGFEVVAERNLLYGKNLTFIDLGK